MKVLRKRKKTRTQRKIDTLILVGNGFDRWQGLDCSYASFHRYYLAHREALMKRLRIPGYQVLGEDGGTIGPVELLYGDPLDPGELDEPFWNGFEDSLRSIDCERLNLLFGKERSGLRALRRCVRSAGRLLRQAFCDWVQSLEVPEGLAPYRFGDNCLFLNFNYTDTLERRFQVDPQLDFHIHGEMGDPESIIFGHSDHPQEPETVLKQMGGRYYGLYCVEEALYETDKHCVEQIQLLSMYLSLLGVHPTDLKQVYVVGHSLAMVDLEYFAFLANVTQLRKESEEEPEPETEQDPLEELQQRIEYVIQSVGYQGRTPTEESARAMRRRYEQEKQAQNQWMGREFLKMAGFPRRKALPRDLPQPLRTASAPWHISCYTARDRQWAETLMKELKVEQYTLYDSIDQCLQPFRCPDKDCEKTVPVPK